MTASSRQERERAHWRAWQEQADDVWGWRTPAGRNRAERRAESFRRLGHMGPQSEVLEVGCGTGEFTVRVAPHLGHLTATDLSPDLLVRARERIARDCPSANVGFEVQDVMSLTFAEGAFDTVFGCSVLHHVDASAALREVHRVLKPDGWCVFSEPNMMNPQIAIQKNVRFVKTRMADTPDETAFFRWKVKRLLERSGFERIQVDNFDFLHPLTPPRLIPFIERIGKIAEACPLLREFSGSLIFCARKAGRSS